MAGFIPVMASIEVLISLALAWLATVVMYVKPAFLTAWFPRPQYLVKTHIDYLLFAMLLFVFHLAAPTIPDWMAGCMMVGSLTNPTFFFIFSMVQKPDLRPSAPLGILSTVSFTITTLGFGGAAVLLILEYAGGTTP